MRTYYPYWAIFGVVMNNFYPLDSHNIVEMTCKHKSNIVWLEYDRNVYKKARTQRRTCQWPTSRQKGVREGFMKEVWIKSFLRNFKILIEEQINGNSQIENCSRQGSLAIHIIILEMFFDPVILVVGILIYECKSFGKIWLSFESIYFFSLSITTPV